MTPDTADGLRYRADQAEAAAAGRLAFREKALRDTIELAQYELQQLEDLKQGGLILAAALRKEAKLLENAEKIKQLIALRAELLEKGGA
jgi:2-phospho-L-lactate transferase/gluconeogenesis factor (CofD/UPF0052 family)